MKKLIYKTCLVMMILLSGISQETKAGIGIGDAGWKWANGVIPYVISSNFILQTRSGYNGLDNVNIIVDAITECNNKLDIKLVPYNSKVHANHGRVIFRPSNRNSSDIGNQGPNGQYINLFTDPDDGDYVHQWRAIHEICHAAGLLHEHQRSDRNNYVTYYPDNVVSGKSNNFTRKTNGYVDLGDYNYRSIMHYGHDAFGIVSNGSKQTTLDPLLVSEGTIGQRFYISSGDVMAMSRLYDHTPQFGKCQVSGDFNGDGYSDLAVGVPFADIKGRNNCGKVIVYYGRSNHITSSYELSSTDAQVWHLDRVDAYGGILGSCGSNDTFGASLAVGDFDGDKYDDLAIGVPGKTINGHAYAGQVNVIYGSSSKLNTKGNQIWHYNSTGIVGSSAYFDLFGSDLVAGDFDGDGADDLAISVPRKDVSGINDSGEVVVIYARRSTSLPGLGLSQDSHQIWHQDKPGIGGKCEKDDYFGSSLAVGDFDGDGADDLVIGVPKEDFNGSNYRKDAGQVNVIYGKKFTWSSGIKTGGRLSSQYSQVWHQDSADGTNFIVGESEAYDLFGFSLTTGDFDNNGTDDLAIGVPGKTINGHAYAGQVNVIYGFKSKNGLSFLGNQQWSQDSEDSHGNKIVGVSEANDRFGYSLAAGDFNGDGASDLVIGVPYEHLNGTALADVGQVNVIYGFKSNGGLSFSRNQQWSQENSGIKGSGEAYDLFGYSLTTGDFDNNKKADLVVGVPFEDLEQHLSPSNRGLVHVIYGMSNYRLNDNKDQLLGGK